MRSWIYVRSYIASRSFQTKKKIWFRYNEPKSFKEKIAGFFPRETPNESTFFSDSPAGRPFRKDCGGDRSEFDPFGEAFGKSWKNVEERIGRKDIHMWYYVYAFIYAFSVIMCSICIYVSAVTLHNEKIEKGILKYEIMWCNMPTVCDSHVTYCRGFIGRVSQGFLIGEYLESQSASG